MSSIVCLVVGFLYFTNLVYEIQTGIGKKNYLYSIYTHEQDFGFGFVMSVIVIIFFCNLQFACY